MAAARARASSIWGSTAAATRPRAVRSKDPVESAGNAGRGPALTLLLESKPGVSRYRGAPGSVLAAASRPLGGSCPDVV